MTPERRAWCLRMQLRILRNTERTEHGCLLWLGRRNNLGYPVMSVRVPGYRTPRPMYVHRISWEAFRFRRFPKNREGAHSIRCISNACVDFQHVRATTHSANMRDIKKARKWRQRRRMEFPPTHTIFNARGFHA